MICKPGDVAVVPFPFSEQPGTKRRPALVLSGRSFNKAGHTILAMITTKGHAPWPGDVAIEDLEAAGLTQPCKVRLKLFTLDNRLILRRAGIFTESDHQAARQSLEKHVVGARWQALGDAAADLCELGLCVIPLRD